jgi:predicted nucleic acid-binding protein
VIYYFDTSVLVKVYHREAGAEAVKVLYRSTTDQIVISNLAIPETFSAFHRKRRDGLMNKKETLAVLRKFFADITSRFTVTPLDQRHILLSLDLIDRQGLRTLDALHLASALLLRPLKITFTCSDHQLLEAAVQEGLASFNPEHTP